MCHALLTRYDESMPPLIIAHRGDSAHRPENTLASFASALEVGADLVELDVQLTRDGHPVIIHDPPVDRTTDGQGPVSGHSLAELRRLSAGYHARFDSAYAGERVPTLAEVLGFLRGRCRVMIEIKPEAVTADAEGGVEALTVAAVRQASMEKDVALISFSRTALLRCRSLGPEILRGHLFFEGEPGDVIAGAREIGSELVMPHKAMLSVDLRDRGREAGLKMATWVVDDPEELQALAPFDLYGVGSNRPGVLLEALSEIEL
jgi:glycerophosphoryl diester phosphodiesterase